jgi:3-hydroxybutyryl-CoA dehydrogenase
MSSKLLHFYQPANLNLPSNNPVMQIVVRADAMQKEEFLSKGIPGSISITWLENEADIPDADAYFDLLFEDNGLAFSGVTGKPVFVNAVIETGDRLPANCTRINAWSGFLQRPIIEISTADLQVKDILNALGWKYQQVTDKPGMIAARVIAMIINEAYFGLDDKISTKAEIDTAMKLGTNYPYGPFEWSEKIGLRKIYALLKKLSEQDSRYTPAPGLENEALIT